jgi:hypothetical protein
MLLVSPVLVFDVVRRRYHRSTVATYCGADASRLASNGSAGDSTAVGRRSSEFPSLILHFSGTIIALTNLVRSQEELRPTVVIKSELERSDVGSRRVLRSIFHGKARAGATHRACVVD